MSDSVGNSSAQQPPVEGASAATEAPEPAPVATGPSPAGPVTTGPVGAPFGPRHFPPAEGKLPPRWLQPLYAYREVSALGYRFAMASKIERVFWGLAFVACLTVLSLSAFVLSPDKRGIGTHEQLGLPPCGFVEMSGGYPCPSCGYTTTFTLAAHLRPLDAAINQPFGFFVFCLTVLAVPLSALSLFGGASLFAMSERWPWPKLFALIVLAWLTAWAYKCALV